MADYSQLPVELTALKQFCVRVGKKPYIHGPNETRFTSTNWARTPEKWLTFQEAVDSVNNGVNVYYEKGMVSLSGIGFLAKKNENGPSVIGGDLDCCRNPVTGLISPWAIDVLRTVQPMYTEVSMSKAGLRFFAFGHLPNGLDSVTGFGPQNDLPKGDHEVILAAKPNAREKIAKGQTAFNGLELYEADRHLAISGDRISEYCFGSEDRTTAISQITLPIFAAQAVQSMAEAQNKFNDGRLPRINVTDVIDISGFSQSGGQFLGPHPTEGSTTGKNLVVDPAENIWAFMHNKSGRRAPGGDAWTWLACECGAIAWRDAGPGALKDRAIMKKTVKYAIEKGLVTSDQVKMPEGGLEARVNKRVQEWIEEQHFKTVSDTERLYRYDHGVYLDDGETVLKALIEREFGEKTTNRWVGDIVGKVKRRTYVDRELFNSKPVLNVKNGLLDLETLLLRPHTPDYLSTAQLDVAYDSTAMSPAITKFIGEVVRPIDIPLIEEIFGWLLWPDYHIHKAVMLLGPGRNGKGTLLRLITAFLGRKSISNVTLQDLVADRFSKADLYGKLANIGGDLPSKDLSDTAAFRNLTGGDDNRAQEKYKAAFSFRNKAKLMFSANTLPRSSDDTYAFYSRWILIEFLNIFDIQKGTADPDLDAKLQTPKELSGLLNIALQGLNRLRKNGWKFSYDKTVEDVEIMYKRNANPVYAFILDECEPGEATDYIEKTLFYNRFKEYAIEHCIRPLSSKKFSELLKDQTEVPVSSARPGGGFDRPTCWQGIKFSTSVTSRKSRVKPTPSSPGENSHEDSGEEKKRERREGKIGYSGTLDFLDVHDADTGSDSPLDASKNSDSIQTAIVEAKGRAEENEAHASEQAKKYSKPICAKCGEDLTGRGRVERNNQVFCARPGCGYPVKV